MLKVEVEVVTGIATCTDSTSNYNCNNDDNDDDFSWITDNIVTVTIIAIIISKMKISDCMDQISSTS